jgi:Leucine-rich repeat (LRR) protein
MDLSPYVRFDTTHQLLEIKDYKGEIGELPDDFFEPYSGAVTIFLAAKNVSRIPSSFDKLANLKCLSIHNTKIRQFPDSLFSMQLRRLAVVNNNLIDFDKEAERLKEIKDLKGLELGGYRGNTFPKKLNLLGSLESIVFSNGKKNEKAIADIIELIGQLPRLKKVDLRFEFGKPPDAELFKEENIRILDRLEELGGWGWGFWPANQLPLALGLTQKINFTHRYKEIFAPFRAMVAGKEYSSLQLQLLFGLWVRNIIALNDLLPDRLTEVITRNEKATLRLLDKPKGESLASINKKLEKYGITTDTTANETDTIVVIGAATLFEEAADHIIKGRPVITVDQLQRVLIRAGDHWLLQEANTTVNDQLLRLLASNQEENYQLAFQMIASGGANKVMQSVLAAIMMAHPDKEIYKPAEKLYDKFGSQSFKLHIKAAKLSLRTGGNIERKLAQIFLHPDIEPLIFRLMYHCIAGSNDRIRNVDGRIFEVKGHAGLRLPEETALFSQIEEVRLEDCEGLDIKQVIEVLKGMPGCKALHLNGCHVSVPPLIGEFVQLQHLEIAYNTLNEPAILQNLTRLKTLNVEGGKIKEWTWLAALKDLQNLNINNNGLRELPGEIFGLPSLQRLEAKQNKLKKAPDRLKELVYLQHLDLSNNQVEVFPYFLTANPNLKELLVRSNKIEVVDEDDLFAFSQDGLVSWKLLNLSRNQLEELRFKKGRIDLRELDISHNRIEELHETIFSPSLKVFYANNNRISVIPPILRNTSPFDYFWLHHNYIKELPDYFAHAVIGNCDLSNNQIAFIHPDFNRYGNDQYARLYWKLNDNPLKGGKIGGIHL